MKEFADDFEVIDYVPKTDADLKSQAQAACRIQSEGQDDIWLAINYEGYTYTAKVHNNRKNILDSSLESYYQDKINDELADLDGLSQEEKEKLIEDYRKDNPLNAYSDEELKRTECRLTPENVSFMGDITNDLQNMAVNKHYSGNSVEDNREEVIKLGLIKGKICLEFGKEYKKWLNRFPEDDPNRKDKALYLAANADSPAFYSNNGLGFFQRETEGTIANKSKELGFLGDMKNLKEMTIKDFFDYSGLDSPSQKVRIGQIKQPFPDMSLETNAYEYFKRRALGGRPDKNDISPVTDDEVRKQVKTEYVHYAVFNWVSSGTELFRAQLKEDDKEAFDMGNKITSAFDSFAPKGIKKWIKEEAPLIMAENKVNDVNRSYKAMKDICFAPKGNQIEKKGVMAKVISPKINPKSDYDIYINKHSGFAAANSSEADKKVHLAKLMSATTTRRNNHPFSVDVVHSFADDLMKRDAFKNLTPEEINRGISSPAEAYKLQAKVYARTFGVNENDRQNYIDEMKQLSQNMMSSERRTDEYKELFNSVKKVSKLKPDSPDFYAANDRLIKAIRDYTKGKKSVRRDSEGRARFDNAMDALAIVNKYIPGSRYFVREQVDRINKVRGVRPGDRNYMDLSNHGAQNAANKNNERLAQRQSTLKK